MASRDQMVKDLKSRMDALTAELSLDAGTWPSGNIYYSPARKPRHRQDPWVDIEPNNNFALSFRTGPLRESGRGRDADQIREVLRSRPAGDTVRFPEAPPATNG